MKAKFLVQDYQARLHGGVILWGGIPHIISTDGESLNILDIPGGRPVARNIDPHHNDLDISSFELGYINTPRGAYYLTRMPQRQYRQSLTQGHVVEYHLSFGGIEKQRVGRSQWLMSEHFVNAYRNPFPRFDAALEMLDDEVSSVALSRDIAITKDELGIVKVWHKLEMVGFIVPGTRTVRVPATDKGWVISMYLSELEWEID